jgi:HEAT repeat protein
VAKETRYATGRKLPIVFADPLYSSNEHRVETGLRALEYRGALTPQERIRLGMLLNGRDPWLRERTAITLSEVADRACLPILRETLGKGTRAVRAYLTEALSRIGSEATTDLKQLLSDSYDDVRHSALIGLATIPSALRTRDLRLGIRDCSSHVRLAAVRAASALVARNEVSKGLVGSLMNEVLDSERNGIVRVEAAALLFEMTHKPGARAEIARLVRSRRASVRRCALTALLETATVATWPDTEAFVKKHIASSDGPLGEVSAAVRNARRRIKNAQLPERSRPG